MVTCIFSRKKKWEVWCQLHSSHLSGSKLLSQKHCHSCRGRPPTEQQPPHPLPRSQGSWESEWESAAELLLLSQWKGAREKGMGRGVEWANQQHLPHLLNRAPSKAGEWDRFSGRKASKVRLEQRLWKGSPDLGNCFKFGGSFGVISLVQICEHPVHPRKWITGKSDFLSVR